MMQAPKAAVPSLTLAHDEPSRTPSAQILGVTIHSGDILLSPRWCADFGLDRPWQ